MQAHLKKTVAMLGIAGALVGGTSAYAATTDIPSTGTTTTPSATTPSTTAPGTGGVPAGSDCPGM